MKVLKILYHPLFFILTLFLGIAIGYRTYEWRHFGQSEPIMLITAIVIMVISMFKDRLFDTATLKNLEEMKRSSNESWETLTGWIKTHLSPTILSLDDNDAVLKQAGDIINTTLKEPSQSNKFIVYVGSGDLLKDPPETDEGNSPLTDYQSALARLKNDGIAISRYISLLDKSDYQRRIPQTRAAYKRWILKQIALLDGNPQYTFYDTPRAPKWGSSRSSIFSYRALLDVIGNGQSGVLVRGDRVAQELLKGSKDLFENAGIKPSVYQAARLKAYLDSLDESPQPRRRTNKG
ncbi:MAG TPA: hypothetical protein VJ875_07445 [Pyrinomonadaceae bacterium]|nr:hypothetical protein [Pyrinomonadaceae bacterium]